ncbi:sugar transporter [Streptomyces sp. NPDC014894]|uniref:sugar transporter n=1 Tax=unclassified Streptomyces TaxID=2593676 RepID=UPI0037023001
MKRKLIAAVGVAAMMVSVAACGSDAKDQSKTDPKDRTGTLTVWLMNDAQSTWPEVVKAANDEFKTKYPKVNVKVQYQLWADKTKKLDAALSGDSFPDVVELGNTETMTYILNGALAPIKDEKKYDNSDTWIKGLKDTCTYEGDLFCVPYYAGARVGIYNAEMFKKGAGVDKMPATEAELVKALDKVQEKYGKDKAFSALYLPGRYWYAAMSYVYAYGGQIAKYDEGSKEWSAQLSTPEAQKGIQHFVDLVKKYNKADKTKDEQDHANVMANEKTAVLYGNAWEAGSVTDAEGNGNGELKGKIFPVVMPGPENKPLPTFVGGSDLGVIAKSKQQDLGEEWISIYTNSKNQDALTAKNTLPNNTKQLEPLKTKPETAPGANAVESAWFTPIAPGWAAIEKKEILEQMLLQIIRGTSVADATKKADEEINALINEKS